MTNRIGEHFAGNLAAEQALPLPLSRKQLYWKCEALLNYPKPTTVTYEPLVTIPGSPDTEMRIFKTTETLVTTVDEGCRLCQRLLYAMSDTMGQALSSLSERCTTFAHTIILSANNFASISIFGESDEITKAFGINEIKSFLELSPKSCKSSVALRLNIVRSWKLIDSPTFQILSTRYIMRLSQLQPRCPHGLSSKAGSRFAITHMNAAQLQRRSQHTCHPETSTSLPGSPLGWFWWAS
jgi:hypothetical protein